MRMQVTHRFHLWQNLASRSRRPWPAALTAVSVTLRAYVCRKVLARLTEAGVVARQHRETSTRMRGRVMLLPVARTYGRTLAPVEAVSGAGSVFSARPAVGAYQKRGGTWVCVSAWAIAPGT
ncbi:hypothetical protein ACWDBO_49085 [Streptomyces mirabilis]|uniref:hypothetical protein n=1 Tax=Streptomyces TaxID=1883 RepID=UPI0029A4E8BD|nr:hypothetical protein [Streptomyces sp. AK02-04a]MDX3763883.1 hypothetical protein [Streptomyces sp. AK02-04a]